MKGNAASTCTHRIHTCTCNACMHAMPYIHTYACMSRWLHVCLWMDASVPLLVCDGRPPSCTCTHTCMCSCVHTCMYVLMPAHICTHMLHMHACMHTHPGMCSSKRTLHTRACIHAHTCTQTRHACTHIMHARPYMSHACTPCIHC
jgi:hypothetical protein